MTLVRRATSADYSRVERTTIRAFVDDPLARWMLPSDDDYTRLAPAFFGMALRRWLAVGEIWTTNDSVSIAAWAPPDAGQPDEVVTPQLRELFSRFDESHHMKFEALGRWMGANRPDESHWYLGVLGTHPDWQGQGLGRVVTTPVHTRADAEGFGCYLETETEENVAIYYRLGYVVRSEWNLDLADGTPGPHMWGMWRAPA
jgi:GNAT superfamily N-acetyltransferase